MFGTAANQFTLELNGAPVTGSEDFGSQPNTGQRIMVLSAGDVLTLVNTSAAAVILPATNGTTQSNASILIEQLRGSHLWLILVQRQF